MSIARTVASIFVVAALLVIWAAPLSHACPMGSDLDKSAMTAVGADCCPMSDGHRSEPDNRCSAVVACSLQMPKLELRIEVQTSNLILASIDWPSPIADQLKQFDHAPPGHPPRS